MLAFALLLVLALAAPAQAAPGDPDFSFGGGGRVTYDDAWEGNAIALQPDGRIVIAGSTWDGEQETFLLVRLRLDGSLDPSFSGDGVHSVSFGPGTFSRAWDVKVQSDGKIVAAGVAGTETENLALVRLNPDGSPDAGFAGNGRLTANLAVSSSARALAIQPDGKIVVAGDARNDDLSAHDYGLYGTLLARYRPNGALDTQFGAAGFVLGDRFEDETISGLALQGDGRIVTAGSCCFPTYVGLRMRRYGSDGTEEEAFAQKAQAPDILGWADDLAVLADGKVLVSLLAREPVEGPNDLGHPEFAVARFGSNGALDPSFAGQGLSYHFDFDRSSASPAGFGVNPDGTIALTGSTFGLIGSATSFVAVRLRADGNPDDSFGGNGRVITSVGVYDTARDTALQPDGRIVTVGKTEHWGSGSPMVVLRYLGSGSNPVGTGPPIECPGNTDRSVRCFDSSASAPQRCGARGLPRKKRRYAVTIIGSKRSEHIEGTDGADLIIAGGGKDRVLSRGGADCLIGGTGSDTLHGGGGNDLIAGGKGNDYIAGGPGNDVLAGGPGRDFIDARGGRDRVNCGPGRDQIMKRRRDRDRISKNCRP